MKSDSLDSLIIPYECIGKYRDICQHKGVIIFPRNNSHIDEIEAKIEAEITDKIEAKIEDEITDKIKNYIAPYIMRILREVPNIVLCGEAILWAAMCLEGDRNFLNTTNKKWDLFMYFDESEDQLDIFYQKLNHILLILRYYFEKCKLIIFEGIATIKIVTPSIEYINIIIKNYQSVSNILHSFNIHINRIAFNGYNIYFTKLSASLFINRVIVMPEYKQLEYIVKLFNLGFGAIFNHLAITDIIEKKIKLPFLSIDVYDLLSKKVIIGAMCLNNKVECTYSDGDHYSDIDQAEYEDYNFDQFHNGSNNYKYFTRVKLYDFHKYNYITIGRIISEDSYRLYMRYHINCIISQLEPKLISPYLFNEDAFNRIFKCSDNYEQLKNFAIRFIDDLNDDSVADTTPPCKALKKKGYYFRPELIYRSVHKTFIENKEALLVCARNTFINWYEYPNNVNDLIDSAEWYGDHYSPHLEDNSIQESVSVLHQYISEYTYDICPICCENISYFQADAILFDCGHHCHKKNDKCDGVEAWLKKSNSCPVCRKANPTCFL